ncbi:MAG: VCBS repeat-containing protein [Polyangiaceae bacterium]|nr:VCBS repeat-containing protein [Polyangiaceae bacterium]
MDSVCRKSTGTFSTSAQRIPGELTDLRLGDFDGDGRQDIVVQGKTSLRVNFLNAQAALAATTTLPVTRGRFITDSLSTDKLATITLLDTELSGGAVGGGLAVYRGYPDRTVIPNIYPFFPLNVSDAIAIPARFGSLGLLGVGQQIAAIADTSPFTRERGKGYSMLFYDVRDDGSNETIPIFPLPELDKWLSPNPAGAALPAVGTGTAQIPQPAVGHFILSNADSSAHTCETMILTIQDPSSVQVLPLCLRHTVADWRTPGASLGPNTPNMYPYQLGPSDTRSDPGPDATLEPRIRLSLPSGTTVGGAATIANVASYGVVPGFGQVPLFDASTVTIDAIPDVLVPTVNGAAVGFGDGTGATHSMPAGANDNKLTSYPGIGVYPSTGAVVLPAGEAPLALGDLNGDSVIDWVDSTGIHFNTAAYDRAINAQPAAASALSAPLSVLRDLASVGAPGDSKWIGAKIVDLNGDGAPDVVAWSAQALDIYMGTTLAQNPNNVVYPTFSRISFPIDGSISRVAIGDIDHDGLLDIAIAVRGDSSGLDTVALYAVFGRTGSPEQPKFLGRLDDVSQLVLAQVSWLLVGTPDQFQSIVPLGRTSDGVSFAAALQGSADRSLTSRFGLVSAANTYIRDVGLSVVAGKFLQPDAVSLVSLGFGTERQEDDRSSVKQSSRLWLVQASGLADFDPMRVQSSTPFAEQSKNFTASPADLLNQMNRTALAAVDLDGDGLDEVVAIIPSATFDKGRILTAKPGAFVSPLPDSVSGPGELKFVNYDFGGVGNVRLVVGDFDGDGNKDVLVWSTDSSQTARILLNNGSGTLDPARSVAVNMAPGIAKVFAATPAGELAVAVNNMVSFYRVERGALVLTQTPQVTLSGGGVESMAFGDVNGDGVDDMVIGFPDAAEVYLGTALVP